VAELPRARVRAPCRRTVCLTGAGGHRGFESFCESELVVGRIDDCRTAPCQPTFATFPLMTAQPVWDAVFPVLDSNADGKLDASDELCQLDVLGYSWGAVNAVDLARRMHADARVEPPWGITRLVLLDAFQPGAKLTIPANVERVVSFRHSVAPPNDCSLDAPFGPYLGLAPRCPPAASGARPICEDFDFSLSVGRFGGRPGTKVGHCDVPHAAKAGIAQVLRDEELTEVPPSVPVEPP
jgi:pimeloyl-ACP methyl ester carboxylesterase